MPDLIRLQHLLNHMRTRCGVGQARLGLEHTPERARADVGWSGKATVPDVEDPDCRWAISS